MWMWHGIVVSKLSSQDSSVGSPGVEGGILVQVKPGLKDCLADPLKLSFGPNLAWHSPKQEKQN